MLLVDGLQASYGRSQVLFDIRLEVGQGEVVTLLGRNGMGKTTTVRSIMGLIPAQAGRIEFGAKSVTGWPPEAIARRGIGLVPEGRQGSRGSQWKRTWLLRQATASTDRMPGRLLKFTSFSRN